MDTLREFLSKYSDVSFVLVMMIIALVFYLLDALHLAGICVLSIILLASVLQTYNLNQPTV